MDTNHERKLADIDLVVVLQLNDVPRVPIDSDLWVGAQVPQSHSLGSEQNIAMD